MKAPLNPNAYARNRFRVGDRVRLSPASAAQFPRLRSKAGVVVGFTRVADDLVRIRFGRSATELYHVDLLEAL